MPSGSWADLAHGHPELAAVGRQRFERHLMAWLSTIRPDGSLRIHPVTPDVAEDGVFMEPASPKGRDLRTDGRYALHCHVPDVIGTGHGEFLISGQADAVTNVSVRAVAAAAVTAAGFSKPPDRQALFALRVSRASGTTGLEDPPVWMHWEYTSAAP